MLSNNILVCSNNMVVHSYVDVEFKVILPLLSPWLLFLLLFQAHNIRLW